MQHPRARRKGKRQRFYARNAVKTTLDPGFSMRSLLAPRAVLPPAGIHPALWGFAQECNGLFARLLAYMGVLGLITILVVSLWDQLPRRGSDPDGKSAWSPAARAYPAFAVSQSDLYGKIAAYEILRNPEGGRKDVLRWGTPGQRPVAELEIYRPGSELSHFGPPIAEIAGRMDPDGIRELQAAGLIDSKFGAVTLLGLTDRDGDAPPCLGFIKRFEAPNLRISGWSCQGETLPARRAAIGCILNRLILLTAGNDPKLAELFAHAELRRADCAATATPVNSADWVTGAQDPRLRGSL